MADKKISQMDYKQLAVDDQFPTINPSLPTENYYALGGDIPVLMGILQWNADTIYTKEQIVIYNSSTVKGMFLVKSTTSAGDAPDGAGYSKFTSLSLVFMPSNIHLDGIWIIGKQRTGRLVFSNGIECTGTPSDPSIHLFQVNNDFLNDFLVNCKFNFNIGSNGQSPVMELRNVVVTNDSIQVVVAVYGTSNNVLNNRYIDFEIMG
jgi:hypothetical protein